MSESNHVVYEKLVAFLKKHKAFKSWLKYTKENQELNPFLLYLEDNSSSAFSKAFIWADTVQGYHYWRELSDEWIDLFD